MVNGGTDFAFSVGKPAFRQHLAFVSGLYTHIFLLYLMHLRMGSVDNLMDRPRKRIVPQLSVGAFLHFFKVKLRFAFSGGLVKNTLGTENFLCGDSRICRVQPVRRTVGTVDILSKCGIGTFFLGKLQAGGRALPCSRTIPHRLGVSLFRFSCGFPLMRSAARRARSAAAPADSSEEADSSVSGSRLLICSTSPVARFSDTAPSRVIFCVILSVAFSSLIGSHLPFHRGRSHRRCILDHGDIAENGIGLGRQTAFPKVFSRSARSSMRSVMRGIPSGSSAQRIRPSILSGNP